ncbi:hypothetical protein PR048_000323 [Dryococelus australis]|uniref:Uncharacterized protein n=1 Tax=Dryococelus australis TaxID=614101 RepID=A0ABQ9IFI0_9NEOP|nr:hypothetical protein PR048_000323 [Dryococelus australis]
MLSWWSAYRDKGAWFSPTHQQVSSILVLRFRLQFISPIRSRRPAVFLQDPHIAHISQDLPPYCTNTTMPCPLRLQVIDRARVGSVETPAATVPQYSGFDSKHTWSGRRGPSQDVAGNSGKARRTAGGDVEDPRPISSLPYICEALSSIPSAAATHAQPPRKSYLAPALGGRVPRSYKGECPLYPRLIAGTGGVLAREGNAYPQLAVRELRLPPSTKSFSRINCLKTVFNKLTCAGKSIISDRYACSRKRGQGKVYHTKRVSFCSVFSLRSDGTVVASTRSPKTNNTVTRQTSGLNCKTNLDNACKTTILGFLAKLCIGNSVQLASMSQTYCSVRSNLNRAGCGVVVRLLTSRQNEPGSIPIGVAPGLSHVGIVPDDAAGQRVFSGISRFPHPFIPALLHTHLASNSRHRC